MALTYTQTKALLDEIAQKSESNRRLLKQARINIENAEASLNNMSTEYSAFVQDLNAIAAANPGDAVWQAAKAEKDKMAAEFAALRTRATNLKNAYDSVVS